MIRLRPHHLLCLQTFVGHGYSDEFVAQMTLVKRQLAVNPLTPIELVDGADDLCSHCPNCVQEQCTSDKPTEFDRLVKLKLAELNGQPNLPKTGEEPSDQCPHISLKGIPAALQITESLLNECCPECEWKELCFTVCRSF